MAAILTFALVAPLGAMGGVAVGERRPGWDRPGRSAVLGLVAACLGIERAAEETHAELDAGLGLALRREEPPGPLLADYHTAQVAPTRRGRAFATRREELAGPRETVLSRRDYRADLGFTAALWRRPAPGFRWSLGDLAEAMRAPGFVPYLGRKSCPLGLPLAPLLDEDTATVAEAFARRDAKAVQCGWPERDAMAPPARRGAQVAKGTVWADLAGPEEPGLGLSPHRTESRRDAPLSRRRWQFGLREEIAADWVQPAVARS